MAVGGYSAGNLEFEIQAMSNNTTASLSKMNKGLKTSALSITDIVNKVYFLRNYTKQMFRDLKGILQRAVDYTETLNLWQVAMRGNREEAEEFVKTMNRAYGIVTQTLMNYQAIFKNMLSSLGGISGDVSYALSEYLTQMALDYASLYNTSIEKAMTTFQSVLSGQVRPIRSIAGYDITETTIYQLYQELGGTKTMRQLSQTEKRLLRIYAVFQQMESSGAVGDLAKTMESTSNQMRIMTEGLKELGTWIGIVFEDMLRPILPYLNAFVITLTNIVKAIAQMRGAKPQEFGMVEALEEANEEAKELTGSLLDFDKFSALSSGQEETNMFGIDQTLLNAMADFDSILGGVSGKAQELAEQWTKWWVAEDGGLTEQAEDLLEKLKSIGNVLGIIAGYRLSSKITSFFEGIKGEDGKIDLKKIGINSLITAVGYLYVTNENFRESLNRLITSVLTPLLNIMDKLAPIFANLLDVVAQIASPIINLISGVINLLDNLGLLEGAVYLVVGAFVAWKGLKFLDWLGQFNGMIGIASSALSTKLKTVILDLIASYETLTLKQKLFTIGLSAVGAAIGYIGFSELFKNLSNTGKIIAGLITILGAATVAWVAYHTASSFGVAAPIIATAIGVGVAGVKTLFDGLQSFKTGGQVEDGIFTMNKGEIIGNFDDGSTVVANNQQIISGIEQGVYRAVRSAMSNGSGGDIVLKIDSKEFARATASANASALSNKYRVDFQPR